MFTKPLKWIKWSRPQDTLPCVAGVDALADILTAFFFVFRLIPEWNLYGSNRYLSSAYIVSGNPASVHWYWLQDHQGLHGQSTG